MFLEEKEDQFILINGYLVLLDPFGLKIKVSGVSPWMLLVGFWIRILGKILGKKH